MLFYFKLGFDGGTLPVGISFYTFQILSYLIDVYRRDEERENSFIRLATYITMFPQLLSGPIVTYGEVRQDLKSAVLPQRRYRRESRYLFWGCP